MEKKGEKKAKAAILKSDQPSCWMGLQAIPIGIPGMLAAPACAQPVLILLFTMVGTCHVGGNQERKLPKHPAHKRKQFSCTSDQKNKKKKICGKWALHVKNLMKESVFHIKQVGQSGISGTCTLVQLDACGQNLTYSL